MKIGCSLPYSIFTAEMNEISKKICDSFGGKDSLFKTLAGTLDSIELRTVVGNESPEEILTAVTLLKEYNLWVTIHGDVRKISTAEEFFRPYTLLFESGYQSFYNITVHTLPTREESVRMLTEICTLAEKKNYPVRITLENERLKNEFSVNGVCTAVDEIVKKVNSPILYTCFDFGHQLSNIRKFGEDADIIPDDFLAMARHTHIHSFEDGKTHFPLTVGETLLDTNLMALMNSGYDEVLNLELEAQRFDDKYDLKEAFLHSVDVLKAAHYQAKVRIENIPEFTTKYKENLEKVKAACEKSSFGIGLVGPAAYVIKIGDKKIAVDISMRKLPGEEESTELLRDFLSDFDIVIVTHNHYDHCDLSLLQSLSESVLCLIPGFIPNELKNKVETSHGFRYAIGDAEFEFFESLHSRNQNIVPEYGFTITYKGEKYVFPADVRTYDAEKYRDLSGAKLLFAHLWLFNAINVYENPHIIGEFCDFVNSFKAEKTYLAHLFDVRRTIGTMWSDLHFNYVKDNLINAHMFRLGDWIEL